MAGVHGPDRNAQIPPWPGQRQEVSTLRARMRRDELDRARNSKEPFLFLVGSLWSGVPQKTFWHPTTGYEASILVNEALVEAGERAHSIYPWYLGYGDDDEDGAYAFLGYDTDWLVPDRPEDIARAILSYRIHPSHYLRDIFGNPFRPVILDSFWLAWNDGAIRKMAHSIYDDRAFDRLPLLADALEDAGCTDADILSHCRTPGEHVRGCWVVDLLLGKS